MVKITPNVDFPVLKISFNNNGKEQFYDFVGQNPEVLKGIEQFLTVLNYNGIALERETLKSLVEDTGCEVFEESKPDGHFMVANKRGVKAPDLDRAYMEFCSLLNQHGLTMSDKTKTGLQHELGLAKTDCAQGNPPSPSGQQ